MPAAGLSSVFYEKRGTVFAEGERVVAALPVPTAEPRQPGFAPCAP